MQFHEFYTNTNDFTADTLPMNLQPSVINIAKIEQVSKINVSIDKNVTLITLLFVPNARPIIASNITNAIDPSIFTVLRENLEQGLRRFQITIKPRKFLLN
jgi:hypothetical protein